jgi:hypothetical protein
MISTHFLGPAADHPFIVRVGVTPPLPLYVIAGVLLISYTHSTFTFHFLHALESGQRPGVNSCRYFSHVFPCLSS